MKENALTKTMRLMTDYCYYFDAKGSVVVALCTAVHCVILASQYGSSEKLSFSFLARSNFL